MIKLNRTFVIYGVAAALCLSAGSLVAQNNNGGNGGGPGGPGGRGFRNMTPEQRQQFFMNNIREQLGFTNDTDWKAVQPLLQKVMDARRDVGPGGGMRMMFRRPGRNDQNQNRPRRGGFFGQPSPQEQALQQAVDNHVPDAQLKQALERYQASLKQKEAALTQAQDNLRKVLTIRQEAQATLMGLLR